jgi:hypothetical protein
VEYAAMGLDELEALVNFLHPKAKMDGICRSVRKAPNGGDDHYFYQSDVSGGSNCTSLSPSYGYSSKMWHGHSRAYDFALLCHIAAKKKAQRNFLCAFLHCKNNFTARLW